MKASYEVQNGHGTHQALIEIVLRGCGCGLHTLRECLPRASYSGIAGFSLSSAITGVMTDANGITEYVAVLTVTPSAPGSGGVGALNPLATGPAAACLWTRH
jgi:hypothetical protein